MLGRFSILVSVAILTTSSTLTEKMQQDQRCMSCEDCED